MIPAFRSESVAVNSLSVKSVLVKWTSGCLCACLLQMSLHAQEASPAKKTTPAGDQQSSEKSDTRPEAARKAGKSALSEQDQQLAMDFAKEHHPELFRLLEQLQKSRPAEFSRGIRDLHQQTQAIQKTKDRNPARYESQLAAWKLDSQIRVLTARWAMTKDSALEKQIRDLLAQRLEMKRSQLDADEKRLREQLRKIEEQKASISSPVEERVAAEWEQLSRKVSAARRETTSKTKEPGQSP